VEVAGHQKTTRDWWQSASDQFELLVSQLVVRECSAGDQEAAAERLAILNELTLVPMTPEAERLADRLIVGRAIPERFPEDALHVALAAVHGIEYLVTWNFRHIANATMRSGIERICLAAGYEPPTICTPEELLGNENA
jgi:predicted nucleic acid-binding protein